MKKNLPIYVIAALLFTALGVYFFTVQSETTSRNKAIVDHFFDESLIDSNGKNQAISQWKGKDLIVNFWATWCTPCVQEMPDLSVLQTELRNRDIQIIGLGIDSPQNIAAFSTKFKLTYPLYIAEKNGAELSRQFGNQAGGLPFTVLLGKDGLVKKTYLGRLKMEELRKDLAMF